MAYDVRPTAGELEEARAVVEVVLDAADRELPSADHDIHIGLGWSDTPVVTEQFGGAIALCEGPDRVRVLFTAVPDGWTHAVMAATARGVGQAWLRGALPDARIAFHWQAVLAAAAGTILARGIAPAAPTPWAERGRLAEIWPQLRPHLGDAVDTDDIFTATDASAYPIDALGAQLAEQSALGDLPDMTRTDVIESLEAVLGSG